MLGDCPANQLRAITSANGLPTGIIDVYQVLPNETYNKAPVLHGVRSGFRVFLCSDLPGWVWAANASLYLTDRDKCAQPPSSLVLLQSGPTEWKMNTGLGWQPTNTVSLVCGNNSDSRT